MFCFQFLHRLWASSARKSRKPQRIYQGYIVTDHVPGEVEQSFPKQGNWTTAAQCCSELSAMPPVTPNPYDICEVLDDPAKRAIEVAPAEVFMFVLSRGVLSLTDIVAVRMGAVTNLEKWACQCSAEVGIFGEIAQPIRNKKCSV